MTAQTTTINAQGDLPLTPELREALGLRAGSPIKITIDGDRFVVEPLPFYTLEELNGMFASSPDAVQELLEERHRTKW